MVVLVLLLTGDVAGAELVFTLALVFVLALVGAFFLVVEFVLALVLALVGVVFGLVIVGMVVREVVGVGWSLPKIRIKVGGFLAAAVLALAEPVDWFVLVVGWSGSSAWRKAVSFV